MKLFKFRLKNLAHTYHAVADSFAEVENLVYEVKGNYPVSVEIIDDSVLLAKEPDVKTNEGFEDRLREMCLLTDK